jgi:hypothetical protein
MSDAPMNPRFARQGSLTLIAAVFAFTGAPVARAQQLQSTGPDPACQCRIVLEHLTRLGSVDDTIAILNANVARDSKGRFYVAGILPYSGIGVFGPDGRHLATLGRRGDGPGEFRRIRSVHVVTGDTLLVHDDRRMTVLDPDGAYVRSSEMPSGPRGFRFTPLAGGAFVLNNYFPTHRAFVLFDRDHRMVREFGRSLLNRPLGDARDLTSYDPRALQFLLLDAGGGRLVAIQQHYRFLVQVWDTSGALVREFNREPSWFTRSTAEQHRALGFASRYPVVLGAWSDVTQRRLWIVASVPDPQWNEPDCQLPAGVPRSREGSGCLPIPLSKRPRAWDSVVEVLDADTGRPLISQRFDAVVDAFTDGGLLYTQHENEDGLMVIDVWRPVVLGRR